LKTCGGVRDFEEVFDSVKVWRFVREFKLRRGMFDPLSQIVGTLIDMIFPDSSLTPLLIQRANIPQ
jgi:hypothetical protein